MKKNIKKINFIFSFFILLFVMNACTSVNRSTIEINAEKIQWDKDIKQGQLENGMKFYIKKNQKPENRISLRLVVHVGSLMEEDDQKGLAHFIEHLAFNGTTNFEKNSIVNYFETIGMKFGPEVNAYTSFEETVYMLEIPADDIGMLKTSLLVLHDWANEISFDEEEIEKERGVINEEWRMNQGVDGRLTEAQLHSIMGGSQFEKRLPIGDMNVIQSIKKERIVDFYKKYYRPENMSVVVVGDVNVSVVEKELKTIMNTIPATNEESLIKKFTLPEQKEQNITIFKDPELKYTIINILFRNSDYEPKFTIEDAKEDFEEEIISNIINQRLKEISSSANSNWIEALAGNSYFSNFINFNSAVFIPKEGKLIESLKDLFDEEDRIIKFGISDAELERTKKMMLSSLEKEYKNKDKLKSNSIADKIVYADLTGDRVISVEEKYKLGQKILNEISVKEINDLIKEKIKNRGDIIFVMLPETNNESISEVQIMDVWKNYKNQEINNYQEEEIPEILVNKPSKKAKVLSTKTIKEFDAKEYVLENGVKLVLKKTENQKDVILMKAVSFGGTNTISDKDYPSSLICRDYAILSGYNKISYNNLQKYLKTKQISLSFDMGEISEIIMAESTNKDFDSLAQLINLSFTDVNFNEDGWKTAYSYYEEEAKNYGNSPMDEYFDVIMETIYGDSIRYKSLNKEMLSKINQKTAEKIYKENFSNISDFTFYFVGDIDEKQLLDSCCYYLGTIPTKEKDESAKYLDFNFSGKKEEKIVYKGIDNQGMVNIYFGGKLGKTENEIQKYQDVELLNEISQLLDIVLREAIREDKGGSYGISVNNFVENDSERSYIFEINFGCDPEREEELINEVLNQIKKLQTEEINDEYIIKLSETYKRNKEVNKKDNKWILSNMVNSLYYKKIPLSLVNDNEYILNLINKDELKKYICNYFDVEHYKSVCLKPEK